MKVKIQKHVAWPPTSPPQVTSESRRWDAPVPLVPGGSNSSGWTRGMRGAPCWVTHKTTRTTALQELLPSCQTFMYARERRRERLYVPMTPGARGVRPFRHTPPCGFPLSSCKSSPSTRSPRCSVESPLAGTWGSPRAPPAALSVRLDSRTPRGCANRETLREGRGVRRCSRVVPSLNWSLGWSPGVGDWNTGVGVCCWTLARCGLQGVPLGSHELHWARLRPGPLAALF